MKELKRTKVRQKKKRIETKRTLNPRSRSSGATNWRAQKAEQWTRRERFGKTGRSIETGGKEPANRGTRTTLCKKTRPPRTLRACEMGVRWI